MALAAMNALGWLLAGAGVFWAGCCVVALPTFLIADTRNNWALGNTGWFGYAHTLCRAPIVLTLAPLYVMVLIKDATSRLRSNRRG